MPDYRTNRAGRGTKKPWKQIRREVYDRDRGICQVCGDFVEWEYYECGHIIDVLRGGSDRKSNLLCMCNVCNRRKPIHNTRREFWDWVRSGEWKSLLQRMHDSDPQAFGKLICEMFGVDEHGNPLPK